MLAPPKAFAILSRGTGHRNSTARHTNPKLIHQLTLFHCLRDRFLGHRLDLLQNCVAINFLLHLLPHFTEKWRNYHPWGFDCVTCSTEGLTWPEKLGRGAATEARRPLITTQEQHDDQPTQWAYSKTRLTLPALHCASGARRAAPGPSQTTWQTSVHAVARLSFGPRSPSLPAATCPAPPSQSRTESRCDFGLPQSCCVRSSEHC